VASLIFQAGFKTEISRSTKMRELLLKEWIRFRHCDDGATLVEYGIAIALAVFLGTGALLALGGQIGDAMTAAGVVMPG
jgi:Flp pilus assembly pilin Flp